MSTPPILKSIKTRADEILIRAKARDAGTNDERVVTIPRTRINYLASDGEDQSFICLPGGEKLQIDLPLTELEKRIYTPGRIDDNIIDLCSLAGRDSPRPTLTTDFNEQQEPQNECMTIHVFARSYSKTANYQPFMLKETDIDWASIQPVWTAERGQAYINRQNASMNKMTHIPLKNGKSPFGNDNLLINMPQADFSAAYTTAKLENQNTLDLRPQTAPQQKNKSKLRGIKR